MINKLSFLIISLVIVFTMCYTYNKGCQDGEQFYKSSHRMYMALKSAYHYGYMDAHDGRPEDWDGPELQ